MVINAEVIKVQMVSSCCLLGTDRQTDVRQKHRLMPPPIRGGGITNNDSSIRPRAVDGGLLRSSECRHRRRYSLLIGRPDGGGGRCPGAGARLVEAGTHRIGGKQAVVGHHQVRVLLKLCTQHGTTRSLHPYTVYTGAVVTVYKYPDLLTYLPYGALVAVW